MSCKECGAPREPGHVLCKFCHVPYDDEELRGAFPCPGCKTLNLGDARQCVSCGAAVAHGGASATHLGPANTHRRHGHVSRRTVVTFSGGHLVFSAGSPAVITVDQILEVRTDTSFNGEYYGGTRWVIMVLQDGEHGFMVKPGDAETWVEALAPRAKPQG
jgi:hypothetical protein